MEQEHFINLRFEDDLRIIAQSRKEFTQMMSLLKNEIAKVGLEMHAQKTKVMTTGISDKG